MSSYNNEIPLYKVAKFRRIREIVGCISRYEKINLDHYNLKNISCYRSFGNELYGNHVKTNVIENRHFLVSNNLYEVYEIPSVNNNEKFTGEFLVLFYNVDFNYYILAKLHHRIKQEGIYLSEFARYDCIGQYVVLECNSKKTTIEKRTKGHVLNLGKYSTIINQRYDYKGTRKKEGYHMNNVKLFNTKNYRFTSGNKVNPHFNKKTDRWTIEK